MVVCLAIELHSLKHYIWDLWLNILWAAALMASKSQYDKIKSISPSIELLHLTNVPALSKSCMLETIRLSEQQTQK